MERFRKLGKCKDAHRHGVWTVSPLHLGQDGRSQHFLTGGADGILKTWSFEQTAVKSEVSNAANGDAEAHLQIADSPCKAVLSLEAHALAVVGAVVARNASVAASTSLDGSLKLWDLTKSSDQDPRSINMDVTESWALALSSNGEILVSCGNGGNVQVFDTKLAISEQSMVIERKSKDSEHRGAERPMAMCAAISHDDKRVAIGAQDGSVTVFDLETGKVVSTALRLHGGPIRSIKYSPTEPSTIITASDDQLVNFYDLDSAKVTGACRGHTGHILCVDVSPDGKHIASAGTDRTLRIWDRGSKECLFKYRDHEETIWDVAYTYDGQRLLSVSDDACIGVIDCSLANSIM